MRRRRRKRRRRRSKKRRRRRRKKGTAEANILDKYETNVGTIFLRGESVKQNIYWWCGGLILFR